ncbi:hypothetical protein Acsp03_70780 [Actinomadura sp. NBRC 104412]|uniref:hypothetical protein n=1 Tax=Actinomadura sp. NBRC 104412 TaxID=3032203 RepID=UPI0024A3AD67|nr:hypothetical protein [Actinomadura sp. NBRC 104412]GLZ09612.1 hypothetical protein Acsp03_70780 [Actinomadura sp. NBRC 104412]
MAYNWDEKYNERENEEYLAQTWTFCPDAPIIIAGYPLTCPRCGSADGIRLEDCPDAPMVRAEHTCVPSSDAPAAPKGKIRRWDEPRVTREFVRRHGVSMLSELQAGLRAMIEELRNGRTGPGRGEW